MTENFIPENYSICKPTSKRIKWENIKWDKLDWDVVIRGLPWQVVRAEYYPDGLPEKGKIPYTTGIKLNHCLGGRYGENNWYCYPLYKEINPYPEKRGIRDEPEYVWDDPGPTPDNIMEYNGRSVCWSIAFEETNYFRKGEMREGGRCTIFRNGHKFYEVGGRDINYGLASAQRILMQLQEHPINFWSRKWKEELIGRKIWYHADPAIVKSIIEDQGCIMVEADTKYIRMFRASPWQVDADDPINPLNFYNPEEDVKLDYMDPNINWFRTEKQSELFVKVRDGAKNRILDQLEKMKDQIPEQVYLELHKAAFQGL